MHLLQVRPRPLSQGFFPWLADFALASVWSFQFKAPPNADGPMRRLLGNSLAGGGWPQSLKPGKKQLYSASGHEKKSHRFLHVDKRIVPKMLVPHVLASRFQDLDVARGPWAPWTDFGPVQGRRRSAGGPEEFFRFFSDFGHWRSSKSGKKSPQNGDMCCSRNGYYF